MQTDPIGYKDDNDLYVYVGNDPLNRTDPSGNSPLEIGFLVADVIELGGAISSGEGLGLAIANVAIDALGVASPVPGISEAAHAIEGVAKVEKIAAGAGKAARESKTYYSRAERTKFFQRAEGKCEYCGKKTQMDKPHKPDSAEGDHFKPQSKGGETTPENGVNACRECNGPGGKGSKEVGTEWTPPFPNERIRQKMDNSP